MGRLVSRKPVEININSPLNGYLPIFDGDTKLWETISTASLFNSGDLISGSSQVLITGTTGYDTLTSSIDLLSSSFLALSGSYQSNFESASFTGSYKGDGTQLYNIPFSGVTGLAFFSASISPKLDALESESGSMRSDFNVFTSSYTTGSFTGSFSGDGSNLYNITSTAINDLNKIVDGSVSASISQTDGFRVNTDVYIDGTITAKEIHTDYVTSSILYQSGSTRFGNSNDDKHEFTGSIHLSDESSTFNIVGNGFGQTYLQSTAGAIVLNPGYGGVEVNGDNANLKVNGYLISDGYISSSTNFIGNGNGLYNIEYSGLTNVPTLISGSQEIVNLGFAITGSNVFKGNQIVSGSVEVTSSIITPEVLNPNGNINIIPSGGLGGVTLHGDLNWVRNPGDPETEIGELVAWTSTMGIIQGGGITSVSGLTVQAGEMVGYTMENVPYATHLLLKINTEGTTAASRQITLPANSNVYVYYTSTGTLTYNATSPSTRTNIILGRVITNSNSVIYTDNTPINAHHYSNYLDRLFREAMGSIFATGGIITENVTPFHLNITASVYFFSQNRIVTTGATNANMDMFYRQATGSTYNIITGNTVDNLYYDNGSGTLTSIPSGKYTKHALYLLGTPVEKYLLVYGQDIYDTYGLAEAAGIPIPPNYFKDAFVLIGSLVVSPDEASIHTIIDERPRLGFISPSKTGVVTEHGDLVGLEHDDHLQYLLVNGTRAMSGDLDMGGNDISNSLSITTSGLTVTGSINNLGSINVTGNVTASYFTGSFIGDGNGLVNIPSTGITNLNKIIDGNVSASISQANGLRINTNTEITGSLIVSSGSATFDATLALTENSSLILNSGSNLYVYDGGIISGTFKGNGHLLTDLPYATTASNQFNGNQTITGSLLITNNLTVLGSSSIVYSTASQLIVEDNVIVLNASYPAERFAGLEIHDSGSNGLITASLFWDGLNNRFIYRNTSDAHYGGAMFIAGPRNTGSLGEEPSLTSGRVPKSIGGDHIGDSNINDSGTVVSINSNTIITGSLLTTGTIVSETTPLVSGSSQIELTGTTGFSTFSSSLESSYLHIEGDGVYSSSAQITGNIYTPGSSFTIQDLVLGAGTTQGKILTDGGKPIQIVPDGTTQTAQFWPNGNVTIQYGDTFTDNGFRLDVSGSSRIAGDTTITGSLIVIGTIVSETTPLVSSSQQVVADFSFTTDTITNSDVTIVATSGDIVLDADGDVYLGSANSGNGIVTDGYLDTIIGDTNRINTGTGNSITDNLDNIINPFNSFTSSYTTASFTGSFKGDGSQLYNIPASGVTGLELNKIISGPISASLEGGAFRVNTDVYIDGTITAREIHTDYVTSSVLYQSGSTKFGNTNDDTHQFTGSVYVADNLSVSSSQITNKNVVGLTSGNQTISTTLTGSYTSAFYNYTVSSGSNARAGQIMVVWNGSSLTYTDNSTTDIGLTKNVELTASLNTGNVVLSTVLPTDGWTIKTLVNLL